MDNNTIAIALFTAMIISVGVLAFRMDSRIQKLTNENFELKNQIARLRAR